jgi:hypothetical protein
MYQLRPIVKLAFSLTTIWLALIWAKLLPRPDFFPIGMEIEPLTVILGTIAVLLFGSWKTTITTTLPEPSLGEELIANLKAKYKKRINSKLAGRFPINLRINTSNKGTSEETTQNFITIQDEDIGHEIGEIFDRAHGRLLVIGEPGAGKTTLLLQLAEELLKRAVVVPATNADGANSVPVLLNLASWRSEFSNFDEWLKRILTNELGVSKAHAEKIRTKISLILLLDGLDEVPEEDRNSCLEALRQYGIRPENQFVISARINEYTSADDAPVYNQVEIAPLTAEQIEMNLIAYTALTPEAKPLLNAIQKDPLLRKAIENPFYLNTAQLLFASRKNLSDFNFKSTEVVGRQKEVLQQFVEYALDHKVKRNYSDEKTEKWLRFLAKKMEEDGLKKFELADLEMKWIFQGVIFRIQGIIGSILMLAALLFLSTVIATFIGIPKSALIIFVLIVVLREASILFTSTIVQWSWEEFRPSSLIGIVLWVIILYLTEVNHWHYLWKYLAWIQIAFILCYAILTGLYDHSDLKLNNPYRRFSYSLKYLNLSIVYHFVFRLLLALQQSLPLDLVHFLNEMSRRHLLEFDGDLDSETGGGTWCWRHRIIQEYFLTT